MSSKPPAGYSLHIAVAEPKFLYQGKSFPALPGLQRDVDLFRSMAEARNFHELPSPSPLSGDIRIAIGNAVKHVGENDLLFVTLSGHGFQVPDTSKDERAEDGLDEAFACEDGFLLDDEVHRAFKRLPTGARAVLIADCCHSATMNFLRKPDIPPLGPPVNKRLDDLNATVLCLAACADRERAWFKAGEGSQLAIAVRDIWRNGAFTGSYARLWDYARSYMLASTSRVIPRWTRAGPDDGPVPIASQGILSLSSERHGDRPSSPDS